MNKNITKLVLVGLALLVVPQLVFAAWWNPLSWFNNWKFSAPEPDKTEVLENRIKELEDKLGIMATSTPTTNRYGLATTTTMSAVDKKDEQLKEQQTQTNVQPKETVTKPVPTVNVTPKNNNSTPSAANTSFGVTVLTNRIGFIDGDLKLTDLITNDADRYIAGIPPLIRRAQQAPAYVTDPNELKLFETIVSTYQAHLQNITNIKQSVDSFANSLRNSQQELRNSIAKLQISGPISLDQVTIILDKDKELGSKIDVVYDNLSGSYKKATSSFLDDKEILMEYLQNSMLVTEAQIRSLEAQRDQIRADQASRPLSCSYNNFGNWGTINCY